MGVRPQGLNAGRAQLGDIYTIIFYIGLWLMVLRLGRETFLFPITWDDSIKWPTFNHNNSIALVEPGLYNASLSSTSYYDNFSKSSLDLGYYFLRTPYSTFWELGKNLLTLWGTAISIGDRDTPSLILLVGFRH